MKQLTANARLLENHLVGARGKVEMQGLGRGRGAFTSTLDSGHCQSCCAHHALGDDGGAVAKRACDGLHPGLVRKVGKVRVQCVQRMPDLVDRKLDGFGQLASIVKGALFKKGALGIG